MLTVVAGEVSGHDGSKDHSVSMINEVVREGAWRMLAEALLAEALQAEALLAEALLAEALQAEANAYMAAHAGTGEQAGGAA